MVTPRPPVSHQDCRWLLIQIAALHRRLAEPDKQGMDLRRITYGGEDELSLVDAAFDLFSNRLAAHIGILDSTGWGRQSARNWLSMRFGECLFELSNEVKHPAFAEEAEWRLYAGTDEIKFRVSADRIVPYIELDLTSVDDGELMPIREITIGPRLDYAEATNSLTRFTNSLGYPLDINYVRSLAPYR